jgi:cytochrome c-type biogenesis protein CcmH/NrfF
MNTKPYVVLAAVVAAVVGLGGGWWAAQPHSHLSQHERLGAEIGCQCGTCPKRPIATCGCAFADGMLSELAALADDSQSDDEVIATLVSRYDPSVRIKPGSTGFGLLAWVTPMLFLTVGAVGVGALLMRWATMRDDEVIVSEDEASLVIATGDPEALAIVERELADLE